MYLLGFLYQLLYFTEMTWHLNKEMLLRIGPWEIIVITWPNRPVSNMESAQSKKGLWLDNAVAGLVFLYHWPSCHGHFVMRGHKNFICKRFFTN